MKTKMKQILFRTLMIWILFLSPLLPFFAHSIHAENIYALSAANTLFFNWFPDYRDYVLTYLNVSDFSVHIPVEYVDGAYNRERISVVYLALLDCLAFEHTQDSRYLLEAKWLVDGLHSLGINENQSVLIFPDVSTEVYWLHADAPFILAWQKLNEHGMGNYDVTNMTDYIISRANVNTDTYLGWYYRWNQKNQPQAGSGQTIDDWCGMFVLLGYLTSKGVKDYSSYLTKLKAYTYLGQLSSKLFKYAINSSATISPYGTHTIEWMILGKKYYSSLLTDAEVNELVRNNGTGIAYSNLWTDEWLIDVANVFNTARHLSYSTHSRVTASMVLINEFLVVNQKTLFTFTNELRTKMFRLGLFLTGLGLTQTSNTAYANLTDHTIWNDVDYRVLTTEDFATNSSTAEAHSTVLTRTYEYSDVSLNVYGAISYQDFDSVVYNTNEQNYLATMPEVYGTTTTFKHYLGGWKTNATMSDFHGTWDRHIQQRLNFLSSRQWYAYPENHTQYNVTAWTGTTQRKLSTYFALHDPVDGQLFIYRMSDSNAIVTYIRSGDLGYVHFNSSLTVTKWRFTIPITITATITNLIYEILDAIVADGAYTGKYSTSLGSAQWQLNHLSNGVSYITDQNITSASFANHRLTFTVSASSGVTSTTMIYCGTYGKPQSISGATSWSYNRATSIATITVVHASDAEIQVLLSAVPGELQEDFFYNFNTALMLLSFVPLIFGALIVLSAVKSGGVSASELPELIGIFIALFVATIVINAILGGIF